MSDISILDGIMLYTACCLLIIYIYIFICNFSSHFKFNRCKCPWIVRDEKVSAIYPTLVALHIFIALIISCLIIYITWNNSNFSTQSISCSMKFRIFASSAMQPMWMKNIFHRIITCAICILLLLETYFSYSRYYQCIYYVMKDGTTPSQWRIFLPFTVYISSLCVLVYFSITMIPIIALFVSIFHVLMNTYYNYYFYISIKCSYEQVFEMQNVNATHKQMQKQINQIRAIFRLSMLCSWISACTICTFITCSSLLRIVPLCLFSSSFCLFLVFNNNKVLLKATILCQWNKVHKLLCVAPFAIVERRRSTFKSRNSRNTTASFKKSKTDYKPSSVKQETPTEAESKSSKSDDNDEKVKTLKEKTEKRVTFGVDVILDIMVDEGDEIIVPQNPLAIKPSSSNQNPAYLRVASPKTDVRKTRSEPAELKPVQKKMDTTKSLDHRDEMSVSQYMNEMSVTIRDWMAPSSFAKLSSEHGKPANNTAGTINTFLNTYGFTTRSSNLFKMDDLQIATIINEEEEADMPDNPPI